MKRQTMCTLGYCQSDNGLMVIHALGHMMYNVRLSACLIEYYIYIIY